MTIKLHKDCRKRLINEITGGLESVKVTYNNFLVPDSIIGLSVVDKILPSTGKLKENLENLINEQPLYTFIYQSISRELYESNPFDSNSRIVNLVDMHNYNNPSSVAERLINEFQSLPWQYSIFFEINTKAGEKIKKAITTFDITDSIKLISPEKDFDTKCPLESGIKNRDEMIFGPEGGFSFLERPVLKRSWNHETVYLQINKEGFNGFFLETNPIHESKSILKSFLGLGIAINLFKLNKPAQNIFLPFFTPKSSWTIVRRKGEDRWRTESIYGIEREVAETLQSTEIETFGNKMKDEGLGGWINNRLYRISIAFRNSNKAQRIILAGQWFFDSYCGYNELLSFVQTIVAMEILLGDKATSDLTGLGALLSNRCAYLIGKSHSERETIMQEFSKIYEIRHQIVHQGKNRLNTEQKRLFLRSQFYCSKIIQEELDLLEKDEKKNK